MTIVQLLEGLVDTIEKRGFTLRSRLRAGLPRSQIDLLLNPLGIAAPSVFYELYEWHDGVTEGDSEGIFLFGEHQFLPLQDAIHEYHEMLTYYDQKFEQIQLKQCLPFASFQGDTIAVYCDPVGIDDLNYPIINIYHSVAPVYEDLEHAAQTVTAWFAAGIYDTHPIDDDARFLIRGKLNPRIPE